MPILAPYGFEKEEEAKQFEITEQFILEEQNSGRKRRAETRRIEAEEESRLAAEIAHLKGFREHTKALNTQEELQRKISDVERSYFNRKMVVSKASQMASSECRLQFTKVREFFDELHKTKKEALSRQHRRSLRRLEIVHRLKKTDPRVKALEVQIADRIYKKKLQDLNELQMAQNMEEAVYMESMLTLLDKVQSGKEAAAKDIFELHVQHLKDRRKSGVQRAEATSSTNASCDNSSAIDDALLRTSLFRLVMPVIFPGLKPSGTSFK